MKVNQKEPSDSWVEHELLGKIPSLCSSMGSSLPAMLTKGKSCMWYVQNQKTLHFAPARQYLFLFPEVKFHHHALKSTLESIVSTALSRKLVYGWHSIFSE